MRNDTDRPILIWNSRPDGKGAFGILWPGQHTGHSQDNGDWLFFNGQGYKVENFRNVM